MRSIDDDAKAVVARVLYEHRRYLLEDALRNFVLLPLRLFLGILADALECFLLLLDLLDQVGPRLIVQLITLSVELLLQALELVVHALQLGLLWLQLLAESFKISATLIGGEDGLFNVDCPHLGTGGAGYRRCRRNRSRRCRGW